ncbi:MAG: CoA transferase [Heliobacteriaceae bacterium]|nr:CoA transferase [Heliobacteriaceae bacterium]
MSGPLTGIKVVELAGALAGQYCGLLLADLGAEVIKVEPPEKGEQVRAVPPFSGGEATYYLSLNRNKRGVAVNIKTAPGQKIVRRLVGAADICIENYRPGTLARYGLGADDLREDHPRLIHCTLTGFGANGPLREAPAADLLIQGYAGIMSLTGEAGQPPVKTGLTITGLAAGQLGANAVLAALYHRERTGQGQAVEVSLLDSAVSLLTYHAQAYWATGEVPARQGTAHPGLAPYQVFSGRDQDFIIAVTNDRLWLKLCAALGLEDLRADPRLATNAGRVQHRQEVAGRINAYTGKVNAAETLAKLKAAGVPCGPINTVEQVLADPQVNQRDMVVQVAHPVIGVLPALGIPFKFSATPGAVRLAPPLLGEHTAAVLQELGYDHDALQTWQAEGIIGVREK